MDVDAELVQFVKARPLEMSFEAGTGRGELWVPSARLPSPQSSDHTAGKGGREVGDHPWPSGHNNTNTNNSSQAAAAANRTGEVSTKKGHTLHTSQGPSAGSFLSARANTNNTSNSNNSIAVTRSEEDAPTSTSFGLSILPTPIPACSELDEQPQQAAQQVAMQRQPHKGQHRSHGRACEASDAHTTAMNATQTTSNTTTNTNTTTTTTTMRGTTVTSLSAALFNAHEDDSRSPTCISASSGHLLSFTSLSDVMTHSQHSGATNTTATTSKTQRSAHRRRMAVELKRSGDVGQPHRNARPPHHAATSSNKNNSNTSGHAAQGGQSRTPRQYVARHARRTTLSSPHVVSAAAAAAAAGAAWAKEPSVHPYSTPARLAAAPSPSAPSKGTAAQTANPVTTAATLSPVQAGYKIWQEHAQRRSSISSSGGSRSDSRRPRRSAAPQLTSAYAVESAAHSPSAGLITPSQSQRERSLTTTTTTITMSQSYTVSKAEETQPQPHVQEHESLRQPREGRSTSSRSHSSHNSSSSNSSNSNSNSNSGGGTGAAAAARRAKEAAREGRQVVHTVPPKQRFTGLTAPPGTTTTTTNGVSDVVNSAAAVERPIVRPTTTGVVSAAAEERHAPAASRTDHDQEENGTVSAHDTALVAVRGEEDSAAAGTAGAAQATTRRTPGESSGPQLLSVHEEVSEAMLSASPAVSSSGAYLKSATVTVSTMTSPTCANMASPALTHSLDAARLSSTPEVSALAATPTSNLTNNSNNMTFAGAAAAAIAASGNNNNSGGSYLYSAQAAPMRAGPLTSEPGNVAARSPRFSPRPRYNMSSSNNANNVALPHSSEAALVVPVRDLSTPALAALLAAGDEVNELDEPIPRRLWPTHYGDHNTTEGGSTSDHAVAMMAPPPPALSPSSRVGSDAAQTGTEGEAGRSSLSLSHVNRPTARPEQNATPGSAVRTNREEEAVVVGHEEPPHRTSSAAVARASGGVAPRVSQGGAASSAARTRSRKGIAATTRTTTGNGVAASSSASSCPASRTPEAHRANDAHIIQSNDRRTGNNSSSNGHRRATALDATPLPAKPPSQTAPTIPTVHDANMSYDAAERQEAQPLLLHSSPSSAASYRETYSAFRAAVEALDRCHAEDAALELTPITPPREAQPLRALLPPPQQNIVPVSGNGRVESAPVHFAADPSSSSAQHIAAREPEDGQEDALLSERVRAVASDGVRAARESESNEEEEDEEAAEGGRRRGPWVPPLPLAQLRVPDMKPPAQPFARHEPSQSIQFSVHSDSGTQGSSCVPDGSHSSDNDRSHRYHSHSRGGAEEEEEEDNDDADSGASLSARAAMTDPLAPVPLPESNKHSRAKNNTTNTNNTSNNNITSSMNNGPVMISGDTSAAMVAQMRIRDMAAAGFDGYAANRALDAGASRGASLAAGSGRQEVTIVSISSLSSSTQVMPGRNLAETGPRLSARGHLSARAADSPLGAYPNSPHTNRSNTLSARNGVREEEYPARPVVPPLRLPVLALSSSSSAAPAAAAGVAPLPPTYTVVPGSDYPPSLRTSNETSAVEVGGSASVVRPGVMREATAPQAGLAEPPPAATPYRDGGNRSQRVKHSGGQCCTVM